MPFDGPFKLLPPRANVNPDSSSSVIRGRPQGLVHSLAFWFAEPQELPRPQYLRNALYGRAQAQELAVIVGDVNETIGSLRHQTYATELAVQQAFL